MRKLNCRPGDLAITVEAFNPINIGSIVRVLHKHHNQSALSVEPDDFLWYVEAAHYLTYSKGEKVFRRKRGAAPDSYLRPIRGNPLGQDIAVQVIESIDRQEGKLRDFEVSGSGTISDPSVVAPIINADLFELDDHDTVEGLILTIECCQPLLFAIQQLAWEKKVELSEEGTASELLTALKDEDFGWKEWIRLEGDNGLNWFRTYIDETWLRQMINWSYVDYFPKHYSGVAVAKQYFEGLNDKTLDALGVEIIEGEHPGSSYYAAEMRHDIDYANQVAREMGLEFRFRLS
jgi:hypothetical protein